MDPMSNPTPTPNPMPTPQPQPMPPVQPVAQPVQPMQQPVQPTAPVMPEMPAMPANPVINPAAGAAPVVQPMNPVFTPTGGGLVGATDPITMPTPPKAPDPVEEELKAPFKAAGPVPGSIGSAISVPAEGNAAPAGEPMPMQNNAMGRTPSVSFNDPAMANANNNAAAPVAKKKISKNTLILLSVVAGLIVVALAIVLVMQLTSGN